MYLSATPSLHDLLELNVELLRDPAAIQGHPLVLSLAQRDPGHGFLCPLIRALVELENGNCAAATATAALATCWLVDESAINRPEDWVAGENLGVVEIVEHRIIADFQGLLISLTFRSEADLLYCSEEYKVHITASTAADLLAERGELALICIPDALAEWLMEQVGPPVAQPEGHNEPLCGIRYQLVGIGHVEVAGPVMEHGYHEITFEGLNENYQQRPDDGMFCWLHTLETSQAQQLGIASSELIADSDDGNTPPRFPLWVSPAADTEACWITAEQLQKSYVGGRRLRQRGNPIRLELGCGLDWDPRHDSEQIPEKDLAEKESLLFSDGHRPLISIQLDPEAGAMPGELKRIGPYLIKLVEAAATGTTD